jgi:hypothetical protein
MKHLFDPINAEEMKTRILEISPDAEKRWGKMDVAQMLAHCGNGLEMAIGIIKPKRVFIGRLIGGLLKSKYTDEKPFDKSSPTSDEIRVIDSRNFDKEKERLLGLLKRFSEEKKTTTHPHPFFGDLRPDEWSRGMYKHLDHHLRQFGA